MLRPKHNAQRRCDTRHVEQRQHGYSQRKCKYRGGDGRKCRKGGDNLWYGMRRRCNHNHYHDCSTGGYNRTIISMYGVVHIADEQHGKRHLEQQ